MIGTYALATGQVQESGQKKQHASHFQNAFCATSHGLRHIGLTNRDPQLSLREVGDGRSHFSVLLPGDPR